MTGRASGTLGRIGLLAVPPLLAVAWAFATAAEKAPGPVPSLPEKPKYNRDIRPILAEFCFACHGPDKAARKGDLRLDIRDEAIKSGALVPGKPDESSFCERLDTTAKGKLMPPAKTGKKLSALQKEILKRWVAAGAEYEPHWAYLPPARPALPEVKNAGWVRNPIDRFILAKLEKRGLTPAPEADRPALARRVSLDLRGIPPSPEEVQTFLADPRPDAYERFVDRLLAGPGWGEHRGRHWLDYARFADTHGIHFDNYREIWAYRDWVITAFNRNLPFDQFTIEQLAGDLLPERTLEQQVASGFNRCNITTNEGGVIPEEYAVLYTRDRTETVAQVWLGMTAGCAVCHEHKLDPLSQREFYQMAAFFNNTTQGTMDGNIKDTPPVVLVPRPEDRPRWITLVNLLGEARRQVDGRKSTARADFAAWLKTVQPASVAAHVPAEGLHLRAPLSEGKGDQIEVTVAGKPRRLPLAAGAEWDQGAVAERAFKIKPGVKVELADAGDFDTKQPFSYGAWVKLPYPKLTGAVVARMDEANDHRGWDLWVQNGMFGTHLIHKWPTDAVKVVGQTRAKANVWNHVLITYDGSGRPDGVQIYLNGEAQKLRTVEASGVKGTLRTTVPLQLGQRSRGQRLDGVAVQDVRVYDRLLSAEQVRQLVKGTQIAWLLDRSRGKPSGPQTSALYDWWLSTEDATYRQLQAAYDDIAREEAAIKARGTVAHVSQERGSPAMAYVLFRGDYDKRRDAVPPDTPKVLPPMPAGAPKNRLGFAQWLMQPGHPLTARVTVNRFWQEVFGTGIVRSSGDFGIAGELPSHPELLDWLALEFQHTGWDVKHLFRLILTSAAYRQAAIATPEKLAKDPANLYLSRGPRYRMDAEMVRDHALAASGLLTPRIGGPSVRPYQPDGVWEAVAMIGSNTRDYRRDSGADLYRRSMYTLWKRSAPPASMDIFNAPSRETCVVRRERTNTPLQALVTLNDEQFVEAARVLAERALKEGGASREEKLDFVARHVLARTLRPEERPVNQRLLDELLAHYRHKPEDAKKLLAYGESKADPAADPATLAGWTMLVNALMNLDEVLNK